MAAIDEKRIEYERTEREMNGTLVAPVLDERQELAIAARALAHEGHGSGLAGQITARGAEPGTYWTLPFGYGFDEARANMLISIDENLCVVRGNGMANPATRFHVWIYRSRPEVRAIIHTHPPAVSALSMIGEPLAVAHMDATMFHDDVAYLPEWPGVPVADEEGRIISAALGTKRSILLAHHGFLTACATIEEATMLAYYFERAAALHLAARAVGAIKPIREDYARDSHDFFLKPAVVNATFTYLVRQVLARAPETLD